MWEIVRNSKQGIKKFPRFHTAIDLPDEYKLVAATINIFLHLLLKYRIFPRV